MEAPIVSGLKRSGNGKLAARRKLAARLRRAPGGAPPRRAAPRLARLRPVGLRLPRLQLPGPQSAGWRLPGLRLAGLRLPGLRLPGARSAGWRLPGLRLAGLRLSGLRLPGARSAGWRLPDLRLPGWRPDGPRLDGPRSAGLWLAAACGDALSLAARMGRWLGGLAVRRSLSPNSLAGISLLLAVLAAAWLSAGTGTGATRGLIAAVGWLIVLGAARSLASFAAARQTEPASAGSAERRSRTAEVLGRPAERRAAGPAGRIAGARYDGTDWLVLPGATWTLGDPAAGPGPAAEVRSSGAADEFGWSATVCSAAAECAIYGGIAAGGVAAGGTGGPIGMWPLAVITVSSIAVAEVLAACRTAAAVAGSGVPAGRGVPARSGVPAGSAVGGSAVGGSAARGGAARGSPTQVAAAHAFAAPPGRGWRPGWPLRLSVGGRALFAAAGYAVAGPQAALLAVAGAAAISIIAAIATLGIAAPAAHEQRGGRRRPAEAPMPAASAAAAVQAGGLLELRDDGAGSRWAGRLVQGMLIPLPPAFAGLLATALLAALGLHGLPGFIALTPPVVMMLAALGSSHPHSGRFDWLVPAMLAAVQFVYFGALGFGLAVPAPLTFAACALTYVWYAGLTQTAGDPPRAGGPWPDGAPGQAAGWETRLITVGLAAALGLATFGYVVLAAYLGSFICRKAMIGYLVTTEDDRR